MRAWSRVRIDLGRGPPSPIRADRAIGSAADPSQAVAAILAGVWFLLRPGAEPGG